VPQVWVRILDKYGGLFASVTMLDVAIPRDAFDFKMDKKVAFPLLTSFPNLSVLTLRMYQAKPDYLAFIMQKGQDPWGKKFKTPQGRLLDRLNLHLQFTNAWAAGLDRIIKGYTKQRLPLPAIWLFFGKPDVFQKTGAGMSVLNQEWLVAIPGLKVFSESLLDRASMMDASATDPRKSALGLPFEYVRRMAGRSEA